MGCPSESFNFFLNINYIQIHVSIEPTSYYLVPLGLQNKIYFTTNFK